MLRHGDCRCCVIGPSAFADCHLLPGIKQEQSLPDFPDLSAALQSFASKRPLDASNHNEGILQTSETEPRENGDHDSQPHKKVKTEHNEVEQQQNAQPSFEDDMDLLVANALSGADLLQEFSERSATQAPSVEPMDLEPTSLAEPPRIAPDFDIEPVKCLRTRSIRALGNLVRQSHIRAIDGSTC